MVIYIIWQICKKRRKNIAYFNCVFLFVTYFRGNSLYTQRMFTVLLSLLRIKESIALWAGHPLFYIHVCLMSIAQIIDVLSLYRHILIISFNNCTQKYLKKCPIHQFHHMFGLFSCTASLLLNQYVSVLERTRLQPITLQ